MDLQHYVLLLCDMLVFLVMAVVYISEAVILTFIPQRFYEKSITGNVALITGGAGGIGRLIAKKLAKRGVRVIIWDINEPNIQETVKEIRNAGGKCWGYYCDVTNRKQIYEATETITNEVGKVHILINNAGFVWGKTLWNLADHEIEHTFKTNILSHYWITKVVLKEMMKDNYGHIVTVASVAGLLGTYNCTDYSATKFAAIGFHESLYTELKTHGYNGIYMTLVCPYFINTGMFHGIKPRLMQMLDPEYVAREVVSGIVTNRTNITLPASVKFLLPLKCLLPAKLCWMLMYRIMQGPQSMMMFKGQHQQSADNNNT